MQTNEEHVTMDGEEWELLERYEAQFGETPPVAFLDPKTSKRIPPINQSPRQAVHRRSFWSARLM
jgi:hypothetical protein